ncbi:MAG TPA: M48 family metalloprotease [Chitinophagales bacterium]|nr:M48 family metalloprotease [Chitinophagales bacterium]
MKAKYIVGLLLIIAGFSCNKNPDDSSINIFSVDDDIQLGQQVSAEIASNPSTYPILDPVQYADAYAYVNTIRNKILNGGNVFYKDEFAWEMHIIKDDATVNAFCTPGGYIYIYTGLLKYLESEDQLAGVMGHEMAHADRRHTTDALTKQYGIDFLLSILLGTNTNDIASIAESLVFLEFSRSNESEADQYSVIYLCPTEYNAAGAAGFFEKLIADGESGNVPVFLSDHPDPGDRLESINQEKADQGCTGSATYDQQYQSFLAMLP